MLKGSIVGYELSKSLERLGRNIPVHPNIITLGSIVFAGAGYLAYEQSGWLSFGLFMLALFVDAIDGAVARAKHLESRKGAFLDGITDRMVEFIIILTLLYKAEIATLGLDSGMWLIGILFFGTCMTSFVKAYAEHSGVMKHDRARKLPGLLERAERTVLLLVIFVLAIEQSPFAAPVLVFTAVLAFATFVERTARVLASKD